MIKAQGYPQYFRLAGHCLKRDSDLAAREVMLPEPGAVLPLCMLDRVYSSKDLLDKKVQLMEAVDENCYEAYILAFIGGVERDVAEPMKQYSLKKQLKS